MNLRSLLLGSVVALGAKAMLVVPEIEADAIAPQAHEPFSDLQLHRQISQEQQLNLICTECPFREVGRRGKVRWTDGYQTYLSLNFSIDHGFLLANGRQIFPPPPPTMITAVQHRIPDDEESEPVPLGYAVEMTPLPMPQDERLEMVEVRFTVLDLDGHPVPLDTVVLSLLHDHEGNLYLAKTEIEQTTIDRMSWKQCRGKPRCLQKLLFNRMRALFAAAKSRMLGLGRGGPKPPCKRPGSSHGFSPDRMPPPFPEFEEPPMEGGRRPHHHHMHHMHHGKWRHTFARMVRFIIVPAILGVSAGLTASALGMLVGQTVVYLWQRYRRSDRKEPREEGNDLEKEGLMEAEDEAQDLPPAYSDEERVAEELPAEKN